MIVPEALIFHVEVVIAPTVIVEDGAKYWSFAGGMVIVIFEVVVETVKVFAEVEVAASVKPEPLAPLENRVDVVTNPAEFIIKVDVPAVGLIPVIKRFWRIVEVGAAKTNCDTTKIPKTATAVKIYILSKFLIVLHKEWLMFDLRQALKRHQCLS